MGYSVLKKLIGKSHPLVHEVVQVHGVTCHFRHLINLWTIKTDLRVWFSHSQKNMSAPVSLTDNLWLHESVAVGTVASSGSMQAQHYLIPLSILTEMLDEKVHPLGVPPIMSFRPRHLHVMPLQQSGSQEQTAPVGSPHCPHAQSWSPSSQNGWQVVSLFSLTGLSRFLPLFLFWFVVVFPDLDFLWPIHLCPRRSRLFWVPDCSCWFFCHRFLRFRGRQTCLSYLSVDSAPYPRLPMQSLWSMMDGYTLDDLIFRRDCSLTEDEVVAYVRRSDPKKGWRHHGTSPFLGLQNI